MFRYSVAVGVVDVVVVNVAGDTAILLVTLFPSNCSTYRTDVSAVVSVQRVVIYPVTNLPRYTSCLTALARPPLTPAASATLLA